MGEALYAAVARRIARRWPAASMRRSAATAISSPIWCGGCWRTAPIPPSCRSPPTRACRSRDILRRPQSSIGGAAARRAIRNPVAARSLSAGAAQFGAASNSATARASKHCSPRFAPARGRRRSRAADRRHRAARHRARRDVADRRQPIGTVREADDAIVRAAMAAAAAGFAAWAATPVDERAAALERAADLLESNRGQLHRAVAERGRQDARRCARRKCARRSISAATTPRRRAALLGAASRCRGRPARATCCAIAAAACSSASARGIFRWRSSSARSRAALVAGNTRGRQARRADAADRRARRCAAARGRRPGDRAASRARRRRGRRGAGRAIRDIAGVVFTGSTEVGRVDQPRARRQRRPDRAADRRDRRHQCHDRRCHRAARAGRPTTSSTSAFRSAGQRCSALRLLCLQDDVADRMLEMIAGAARELKVGDPRDIATHVGPVIDAEAKQQLDSWIAAHGARRPRAFPLGSRPALPAAAIMSRRHIVELDRAGELNEEVFGPVLHVVRWRADELDALLDDIAAQRHRADARHPFAHRPHRRAHRRAACRRQYLRQSQHDRRGGRHAAVRRHAACPAPAPRPAARIICAALPPSRSSRSTPPPPAAMPSLLAQDE